MTKANDVYKKVLQTITREYLACENTPVLLMVSGGCDSTALAYIAHDLHKEGAIGPLAMLHVNHCLRGEASDGDQAFVETLAELLGIPLFVCTIDVGAIAKATGGNVEAVARAERYQAADDALQSLCVHVGYEDPYAYQQVGVMFTAHTQNDRVENFYMRSIVGTGPGGFRSMRYRVENRAHPLLDVSRDNLRAYIQERANTNNAVVRDEAGRLWREDATNADTSHLRAFVRHEIVPRAMERNPQLLDTLCRTMNLIAEEDDVLTDAAYSHLQKTAQLLMPTCDSENLRARPSGSFLTPAVAREGEVELGSGWQNPCREKEAILLLPSFSGEQNPLLRRACYMALQYLLGAEARIEASSVERIFEAFDCNGKPIGGYTANIQGDLAVSANKQGVLIEEMEDYRARRKKK